MDYIFKAKVKQLFSFSNQLNYLNTYLNSVPILFGNTKLIIF